MAGYDSSDRTQPASSRRRREAREQGQIWQSGELSAALTLGGVGLLLSWQGAALVTACGDWLHQSFASAPIVRSDHLSRMASSPSLTALAASVAGLLIGVWLIAVIVRLVQVGPLFVPRLVQPRAERVNLPAGWRRMTSAAMLFRGPFWVIKLLVIGSIVWWTLIRDAGTLAEFSRLTPAELAVTLGAFLLSFVWRLCGGILLVGAIDVAWQWRSHERRLRMTPDEVRAERRDSSRPTRRRRPVNAEGTVANRW